MKKLIVVFAAGVMALCLSLPAGALEITVSPNFGTVLSPDLSGTTGGLGYTARLLMAGSMFLDYEVGFESGQLPIAKNVDTIPITAVIRYNFFTLGDIKPYIQTTAGVYYTKTRTDDSSNFGASMGLGTRLSSTRTPVFADALLRGTFIYDKDFEDNMLLMLHMGFGLGLRF